MEPIEILLAKEVTYISKKEEIDSNTLIGSLC